jgi:RNA polymerase sigma-70 factor (ECF subfamily)
MSNSFRLKTDNELIQEFQNGDLYALEVLVLRHKDKMFTSIQFLVKDKYLAEDIFQDVLIKVIDTIRAGKYTEEGKFLPWAMRIAHNLCVDHFRKVKRTPTIRNSEDKDQDRARPSCEHEDEDHNHGGHNATLERACPGHSCDNKDKGY